MNAASTSEPDPSSDSEEGQDFILLEVGIIFVNSMIRKAQVGARAGQIL